ncbi:MAG: hypothetical protein P4L98_09070 [Ancalomicrobiaceae bacterium]|nr:hypothetical protein [Ancalomicrobiaceae bacterium]
MTTSSEKAGKRAYSKPAVTVGPKLSAITSGQAIVSGQQPQ